MIGTNPTRSTAPPSRARCRIASELTEGPETTDEELEGEVRELTRESLFLKISEYEVEELRKELQQNMEPTRLAASYWPTAQANCWPLNRLT